MQRFSVGILAVVLLILGALALVFPTGEGTSQNVAASCLRVGLILSVLWLAMPDLLKPASKWIVVGTLVAVLVLAKWPKLFVFVAIFLVAMALLRPRVRAYTMRQK